MSAGGAYASSIWESLKDGDDVECGIKGAGLSVLDPEHAPQWVAAELVDLGSAASAFGNEDLSVLGFFFDDLSEGGIEGILSGLAKRGWTAIDSGFNGVTTLVKEEGECRWMMIDARSARGGLDVVMRIRRI